MGPAGMLTPFAAGSALPVASRNGRGIEPQFFGHLQFFPCSVSVVGGTGPARSSALRTMVGISVLVPPFRRLQRLEPGPRVYDELR